METLASTLDPQVIHSFINSLVLLVALVVWGVTYKLVKKNISGRPSESLVHELRRETERFSGQVADLEERFTRFQKREGMRHARSKKDEERDLVAEAAAIAARDAEQQAAQGGSFPTKAALYRKLRAAK